MGRPDFRLREVGGGTGSPPPGPAHPRSVVVLEPRRRGTAVRAPPPGEGRCGSARGHRGSHRTTRPDAAGGVGGSAGSPRHHRPGTTRRCQGLRAPAAPGVVAARLADPRSDTALPGCPGRRRGDAGASGVRLADQKAGAGPAALSAAAVGRGRRLRQRCHHQCDQVPPARCAGAVRAAAAITTEPRTTDQKNPCALLL